MKKITLAILISLTVLISANAQKIGSYPIALQTYIKPTKTDYINYQTYNAYTIAKVDEITLTDIVRLPNMSCLQWADDGDFQIIVEYNTFNNLVSFVRSDTTFLTASKILATVTVYDKLGKQFYAEDFFVENQYAFVKGIDKNQTPTEKKAILLKQLINNTLPIFTSKFVNQYVPQVVKRNDAYYTANFAWLFSFVPKGIALEVYNNLEKIKATTTLEELQSAIKEQLPFWYNLTEMPQTKEDIHKVMCGYFNLSMMYYILGDEEKSAEYYRQTLNFKSATLKSLNNMAGRYKGYVPSSLFQKPDISQMQVLHDVNLKQTRDMSKTILEHFNFVLEGSILMNDDTKLQGKIIIPRKIVSEKGIINFDKSDYPARIFTVDNKTIVSSFSKINQIQTDGDNSTYVFSNKEVVLIEHDSPKIKLYRIVFPIESERIVLQKGNNKAESTPLLTSSKTWFTKFFSDCSVLTQKIANDEIKIPIEIVRFYDKECK